MEQTKFKRFKKIVNNTFICTLIVLTFLSSAIYFITCDAAPVPQNYNNIKIEQKIDTIKQIHNNTNVLTIKKDSIKNELIKEVQSYVKRLAPKSHNFIPTYLVHAGLNHNIDICFMMAQTELETRFGTLGAGREVSRRSMFGVANKKYINYNDAIEDYCKLLKTRYLSKNKNEQHLLTKYVTLSGRRYAENPHYEKKLTRTYLKIKRSSNIYNLQEKYHKL